jgi:hypothetical protein
MFDANVRADARIGIIVCVCVITFVLMATNVCVSVCKECVCVLCAHVCTRYCVCVDTYLCGQQGTRL